MSDASPAANPVEPLTDDEITRIRAFFTIADLFEASKVVFMVGSNEVCEALLELANERLAARTQAAEHDQPEHRATYSEVLAEKQERLLRGETVIVPRRYPGLSEPETRKIGRRLRELALIETACGVVQDAYARKEDDPCVA